MNPQTGLQRLFAHRASRRLNLVKLHDYEIERDEYGRLEACYILGIDQDKKVWRADITKLIGKGYFIHSPLIGRRVKEIVDAGLHFAEQVAFQHWRDLKWEPV